MNEDPEEIGGQPETPTPEEIPRLREELRQAREEAETLRARSAAARSLREALAAAGAMPEAVELLADAVPGERLKLTPEGALEGGDALLDGLRSRYGFLFSPEAPLPTAPLAPPREGAPLRASALRTMSAEEINHRWAEVREALKP